MASSVTPTWAAAAAPTDKTTPESQSQSYSQKSPSPAMTSDPLPPSQGEIVQAPSAPQSQQATPKADPKRIHCLVVDTGPLIKNEPALSTLIAQADQLYTIPSVLSEIKDEATRSRVQTQLLPFLKLRSPRPDSIKFITDFSRRTGDLEVLSKPDIHLLALCYELELEGPDGDSRVRKDPGQRGMNGKPPAKEKQPVSENKEAQVQQETAPAPATAQQSTPGTTKTSEKAVSRLQDLTPEEQPVQQATNGQQAEAQTSDDDDSDGWITPANLKKHQAKDGVLPISSVELQETLQTAILTSDFAMQNVALRINLHLVSPSNLSRITKLKTWVLRCYGCFTVTRQMQKQFCPKCGQATLTRTSCSTDAAGNTRLHLKKNFQYNKRGNVYSVPKPVHGSASGKLSNVQGGGKKGWGRDLILAEDQKEYIQKTEEDRRARYRDIMDEDYLPGILTGDRTGGHGRIKVGAGRSVNAKKRG